jgi:hypothetical protein
MKKLKEVPRKYAVGSGLTTSLQTPIFTSVVPVIAGNVAGSTTSEIGNAVIEQTKKVVDGNK